MMDERSSTKGKKKKEHDFSLVALRVVQKAAGESEAPAKSPQEPELTPEERHAAAVALGRLGGKKGGKARASKLTPEQRKEIAKKAAATRWGKSPNP